MQTKQKFGKESEIILRESWFCTVSLQSQNVTNTTEKNTYISFVYVPVGPKNLISFMI